MDVKKCMTRAIKDANDREGNSTEILNFFALPFSSPYFYWNAGCNSKSIVDAQFRKNLEVLYEVLAPGSNIFKFSPITSTNKELAKAIIAVRNSVIAKFGTQKERQIPLEAYADHRGPRTSEKLVGERIQSHIKEYTRKWEGDKKMKHSWLDSGSSVSSSRSDIARALAVPSRKLANFLALRI